MKKQFLFQGIILVLLSISLNSCKKDPPLSQQIIGKWAVESITQVTFEADVKKTSVTYYLGSAEMAYQFAEGGTGIYFENGDVFGMFSYTLNGSTLTLSGSSSIDWNVLVDNGILTWTFSESEVINSVNFKYDYTYNARKTAAR